VPGFRDNAKFAVIGAGLVAGPAFTGGAGAAFSLRLRATDTTSLSVEQTFALTVVDESLSVIINEIHYNGTDNTIPDEFIELYNRRRTPSIFVVARAGGIDYFMPANTSWRPTRSSCSRESGDDSKPLRRHRDWPVGWRHQPERRADHVARREQRCGERGRFKSEFPCRSPQRRWAVDATGPSVAGQQPRQLVAWGVAHAGRHQRVLRHQRRAEHPAGESFAGHPASTNAVLVTAKVTDPNGVASVSLAYQVIAPGSYISSTIALTRAQLDLLNTNPA